MGWLCRAILSLLAQPRIQSPFLPQPGNHPELFWFQVYLIFWFKKVGSLPFSKKCYNKSYASLRDVHYQVKKGGIRNEKYCKKDLRTIHDGGYGIL